MSMYEKLERVASGQGEKRKYPNSLTSPEIILGDIFSFNIGQQVPLAPDIADALGIVLRNAITAPHEREKGILQQRYEPLLSGEQMISYPKLKEMQKEPTSIKHQMRMAKMRIVTNNSDLYLFAFLASTERSQTKLAYYQLFGNKLEGITDLPGIDPDEIFREIDQSVKVGQRSPEEVDPIFEPVRFSEETRDKLKDIFAERIREKYLPPQPEP